MEPQVKELHFSDLEFSTKAEKNHLVKKTDNKTGNIKFKKNEKSDSVNIKENGKITR